jgi:UDP-N-acetylmuramoyl-L-alanyl-D-glutamate--2,6-diaminopimelate ligase
VTAAVKDIAAVLATLSLTGDLAVEVCGVSHDSRAIRPGWLFVAIPGEKSDGHDFVAAAVHAGAAAVLAERPCPANLASAVPWIEVPDTRKALGLAAAAVFGLPTTRMVLVGVTGTNGKTSLTYLLEAIVKAAGGSPGVIGTITYRWGNCERAASRTTPEASELQSMLAEMADAGVTHVLMEVSSHGLHLGRLDGCQFDLGVFTNLTQDHLDFHGSFEDYYQAKRLLFTHLLPGSSKKRPVVATNLDDPYGRRLAGEITNLPVIGYGTSADARVRPKEVSLASSGITGTLETGRGLVSIRTQLTGTFNLQNVMAAVAVAEGLDIPVEAVQKGIEAVRVVPGRLERIPSPRGHVFVDYAHTPDALKNVLAALHSIRSGHIITVMGCGGDRDRAKRPLMGTEAAAGSDFVVVTSDNPRSEDPMHIIHQIEEGVRTYGFTPSPSSANSQPLEPGHYRVMPDRREAIAWAVQHLQGQDILLVAGKGHETYQEINGVQYPFDDREALREELTKLSDTNPGSKESRS